MVWERNYGDFYLRENNDGDPKNVGTLKIWVFCEKPLNFIPYKCMLYKVAEI